MKYPCWVERPDRWLYLGDDGELAGYVKRDSAVELWAAVALGHATRMFFTRQEAMSRVEACALERLEARAS